MHESQPKASLNVLLQKTLRIQSIRANIRLVEEFLLDIHEHMVFDETVLNRIMVSVTEAVNNGIIHGNKADPEKWVQLRCTCFDDRVEFGVSDEGPGFIPEDLPDPLDEANLLKEGGRGILIIRAMMDDVSFVHHDGGMELRLTIARNPAAA